MNQLVNRPPGYFERLRELFDRIAEMPEAEREAEIARATETDPTLEKELRALFAHADIDETMFDGPPVIAAFSGPPLPIVTGYRVHRRIGRGGSATVYFADQERTTFTRTVALKVIDTIVHSTSLWHVREEQRILARLEHAGSRASTTRV